MFGARDRRGRRGALCCGRGLSNLRADLRCVSFGQVGDLLEEKIDGDDEAFSAARS